MAVFLNQAKNKILAMRVGTNTTGSLKIVNFAVSDYAPYSTSPPSPEDTSLLSPVELTQGGGVYLKAVTASMDPNTPFTAIYQCDLTELECVGHNITAIGLYDNDGMLVCIKSFSPKAKTNTRAMTFRLRDTFEEG